MAVERDRPRDDHQRHDRASRARCVGRTWLLPDEAMTIRVAYHADEPTDDLLFGIAIHDEEGNTSFGTNTKIARRRRSRSPTATAR